MEIVSRAVDQTIEDQEVDQTEKDRNLEVVHVVDQTIEDLMTEEVSQEVVAFQDQETILKEKVDLQVHRKEQRTVK